VQLLLDRRKVRNKLDAANAWRNLMLWEAAEPQRHDFEASGMAPNICGSFQPRVTCGRQSRDPDRQADAFKRYKKSIDAIGRTLRPVLFCVAIANDWARVWRYSA
jgi:hypothetical protein